MWDRYCKKTQAIKAFQTACLSYLKYVRFTIANDGDALKYKLVMKRVYKNAPNETYTHSLVCKFLAGFLANQARSFKYAYIRNNFDQVSLLGASNCQHQKEVLADLQSKGKIVEESVLEFAKLFRCATKHIQPDKPLVIVERKLNEENTKRFNYLEDDTLTISFGEKVSTPTPQKAQ